MTARLRGRACARAHAFQPALGTRCRSILTALDDAAAAAPLETLRAAQFDMPGYTRS